MAANKIKLKNVTQSELNFLYGLLSERTSKINISHKKMPTLNQHKKFVNSKPYSKWYIILLNDEKIGSLYLSKINEIGISIKKKYDSEYIKKFALKLLIKKHPRSRYLVNINPKNNDLIKLFKKNGFKLIQYTFELEQ